MFQRTKIVATLGPSSEIPRTIAAMIKAGMDVARLNASHGARQWHARTLKIVRDEAERAGEPVGVLFDLQGPKIRVGELPASGLALRKGERVTLVAAPRPPLSFPSLVRRGVGARNFPPFIRGGFTGGVAPIVPIAYPRLTRDLKKGAVVLFDDGNIECEAEGASQSGMVCRVKVGGTLLSRKGVHFSGASRGVSSLTDKDRGDLECGLEAGVDFVALSFVRRARDVRMLRRHIRRTVLRTEDCPPQIVAKIETASALEHFDEIAREADAVMIARGDLALDIPSEQIPIHQKTIIAKCRAKGIPTIVATEMLGSMVGNPRPTRAEISDVANAVIDHADALMLSGETASGKYPVEAVQTMARIIGEAEASHYDDVNVRSALHAGLAHSPSWGAVGATLAAQNKIAAIVVAPERASEIGTLARFRPELPIMVGCRTEEEARQINLIWGTLPVVVESARALMPAARKALASRRLGKKGSHILLVGRKNAMRMKL